MELKFNSEVDTYNNRITLGILAGLLVVMLILFVIFNQVGTSLEQDSPPKPSDYSVSDQQELPAESSQTGIAIIPQGQKGVFVNFAQQFKDEPVVLVTPVSFFGAYSVTEISSTGFLLEVAEPIPATTYFNWLAR